MMEFKDILEIKPYSLKKEEKEQLLCGRVNTLHHIHYEKCKEYKKIVDGLYDGKK